MASKKRLGDAESRRQLGHGDTSRLTGASEKRVVRETEQRPVRAQPMRGPGAIASTANGSGQVSWKDTADPSGDSTSQTEQQAKMKEDVCSQLLIDGYVQSFVDLFYLTHRNDPTPQHRGGGSTSETQQANSNRAVDGAGTSDFTVLELLEMEFLRDQLVSAEHCKRRGEIPDVMAAYDSLATYCAEKQDNKTMIFFYDKCLEITRLVKDQISEMRVLSQIGSGYHAAGDLEQARQYLELCVAIAKVVYEHDDDEELRGEAHAQLGGVYVDLASRHEQAKRYLEAIDLYKLRLDCADKAHNAEARAHAQFKIGTCYNALNEPANALPFLETNLAAARQSGDAEGEGNACAALATAHEKLGNQQLSIDFLNHYVTIATRAENVVNQADACARLGQIYTASLNFQRAREMHEKNYELVQAVAARTGDRLAQNISRVSVGAARANDKLATLLALVKDDFHGLLAWKNTRAVPTTE
ncbi:Tetratricopeptide repeat protein 29 [Phytophthora pseudosyringae]|uniref:Tetratricopeptide repeat protein 29 n=1 Tax=Phytophthora pseudosyringae TaxID=221518 RepID=A0A8T1VML8_9STRA|nr:Tetratricopeptide repeat protein 29 [Phytophthora pseudosyringae]